jgi:photosystem II stability/assembly factor-like uncharacterized protein
MLKTTIFLLLLITTYAHAQKPQIHSVETNTKSSFRGLSVIDDSVAWVSGNKGWVGRTIDGGRTWKFSQVAGFEHCDFRSIYAFDAQNTVIANAGAPAYVLRTNNGGASWQKVYENVDSAAFIDGIDFRNKKDGLIYGDAINGRMLLVGSSDGGNTWIPYPISRKPLLKTDEASFAASGTCIKYAHRGRIIIATGGNISRLHLSQRDGKRWRTIPTPILQGQASTGIFSLLLLGKRHWLIAGGDYKREALIKDNLFYTYNGGKTWHAPKTTTRGYRECVAAANDNTLIAVGPGGFDISYDNGNLWEALYDETQYHVIRRSRKGKLMIAAGGNGKLSLIR